MTDENFLDIDDEDTIGQFSYSESLAMQPSDSSLVYCQ
jgi:hypothetical protein